MGVVGFLLKHYIFAKFLLFFCQPTFYPFFHQISHFFLIFCFNTAVFEFFTLVFTNYFSRINSSNADAVAAEKLVVMPLPLSKPIICSHKYSKKSVKVSEALVSLLVWSIIMVVHDFIQLHY